MIEDGLDALAEKVKVKIDPKRKKIVYIYIFFKQKKTKQKKTNPIQGLVVCACQTKNR